ncbi:hypothetical protein PRUPE_4G020600 [Prunus persica]|uniref:Pectate lyase n=1 Tax=Prunus persica TaxID=3760 RepID=A0A251PEG5_PRUPE|nr:hypothetical protein PRUPE_4G020600 [Prunus persica]
MASLSRLILLSCFLTYYIAPTSQAYSPGYYTTTTPKTTINVVDLCLSSNSNWATNRRTLANWAVGFGQDVDDHVNPQPGSLRYGVIETQRLWIVFAKDMVITLKNKLIMNSFKTIDGRGAKVEIAYGPCITVGHRRGCDGDATSHVWVDHCFLARSSDGLIDVTHASTAVTITDNYFSQHDKVMLLGHNDNFSADEGMKVTIAFNRFGAGLIERMPRYDEWKMYAVGGSANPTIFSEGNYFIAPETAYAKQATKRESRGRWNNWICSKMVLFFVQSGYGSCYPLYSKTQSFKVLDGSMVPALTSSAGPLRCFVGKAC